MEADERASLRRARGSLPDAAAVADDGTLAVLEAAWGEPATVSLYSREGAALRSVEPSSVYGDIHDLAFDRSLLVFAGAKGLVAYDAAGKPLWRFQPSQGGGMNRLWRPSLTESGELLLFDGDRTLHRYRLQDSR